MSGGIPITDPVELAWCEFARRREERWDAISTGEQGLSIASFKAGVKWEAARVRRELLEEISAEVGAYYNGGETAIQAVGAATLLSALDRIIPEER